MCIVLTRCSGFWLECGYEHIGGRVAISPAGCVHAAVSAVREGGPAEDSTRLTPNARPAACSAAAAALSGRPRREKRERSCAQSTAALPGNRQTRGNKNSQVDTTGEVENARCSLSAGPRPDPQSGV
jgi:hypothetical protein